jgi:hypothetical protein
VAWLLWLPLIAGCDAPAPRRIVEVPFADARDRVVVDMLDRGTGFPDAIVEYEIRVEHAAGGQHRIAAGSAQIESVRARVSATRLASGDLAVARATEICAVTGGATVCADVEAAPAPRALREALAWRAADGDTRDRARAAIALAPFDRDRALATLDELDGTTWGDGAVDAAIRGTRARVRGDRAEIAALRSEISRQSGVWLAELARTCVASLEPDLRAELAGRPASVRTLVHSALATCAR